MLQKNKEQLKKYSKLSLIGFIEGMISVFFSTGGGLILVPDFLYLLEIDSQKARGTSVFCILPMVITSSIFYYKSNYINWNSGILCAIGGIAGGYIGAKILKKVPDYILKIVFVIFILYYSFRMLFL